MEYPVLALESGKPRRSSGQAAIVQAVDVGVVWIRAHLAQFRSSTNPLTGFAWTLNHQEAFSSIDEFEPRFAGVMAMPIVSPAIRANGKQESRRSPPKAILPANDARIVTSTAKRHSSKRGVWTACGTDRRRDWTYAELEPQPF